MWFRSLFVCMLAFKTIDSTLFVEVLAPTIRIDNELSKTYNREAVVPVVYDSDEQLSPADYTVKWYRKISDTEKVELTSAPRKAGSYLVEVRSTSDVSNVKSEEFVISPKEVVGAVRILNKEYDGTDVATVHSITIDGIVMDDEIRIKYGTAKFVQKTPGKGIPVVLEGFLLEGQDAGNYTLVLPTDLKADITREVPQSSPNTADTSTPVFWGILCVLAGSATVMALGKKYKKKC